MGVRRPYPPVCDGIATPRYHQCQTRKKGKINTDGPTNRPTARQSRKWSRVHTTKNNVKMNYKGMIQQLAKKIGRRPDKDKPNATDSKLFDLRPKILLRNKAKAERENDQSKQR